MKERGVFFLQMPVIFSRDFDTMGSKVLDTFCSSQLEEIVDVSHGSPYLVMAVYHFIARR